jgi:cytochrome c5
LIDLEEWKMKREVLVVSAVAAMITAVPVVAAGGKAVDGKALYEKSCAACHKAMNPKLGDKAAWAPLLKQGTDALVASTIKGKGVMPARGGAKLSDDEIKAAVEYLASQAK